MSSLLKQLGDDEAILMMYVAGELPPVDVAEVDRRLAADAGLRQDLDRLRAADHSFTSAMRALDGASRPAVPESPGVRRVKRTIRQWQADRLARPAPAAAAPDVRFPWWAYPLAAAASVVVAFMVWWGNADRTDDRLVARNVPLHFDTDERPSTSDMLAAMIYATSAPVESTDEFASLVDPSDYAVLAPLMDESEAGGAPRPESDPADLEREQDDWYLFL